MTMPVTTLDQRFSDPPAAAISWDETSKALESAGLFWISTVRADGVLYFCTGEAEQKAINLNANPHVVLTTGCNGWDAGLDVMVEGEAVRVTDDATLGRLAQAWTTKWDGQWHFEVRDGSFRNPGSEAPVLVFAVAPAKVLAFTKGTFSHTRHLF